MSSPLFNCTFVDTLNGWAAGDLGIIVHTSDGGNTFVIQNTPVNYYINDIFFINKRLGWAVANEFLLVGSTILKTTNGGKIWTAEDFPDSTKIFRTIYFLDSLNGYLGGFEGAIFKTTNAGNTWFETVVDTTKFSRYPIKKFDFSSSENGFACGGQIDIAGVVWMTTNSGLFWTAEGLSPEPFYDMYIRDAQNIIAAGGDFEYGVQISTTSNAGTNWTYESLKLFGQAESIDFRTENEVWMPLGFAESWAVSYDTGKNWTTIPTTDSAVLYSVVFVDSLHGWAVGNDGVILKYNKTKVTSDGVEIFVPNNFYLHQNFPNPFNPTTVIRYSIPRDARRETQDVKLFIYDALGKEVMTLVNGKQNSGDYEITFDGSDFSSGIYFYRLEAGNFIDTRSMVLIK